ncbi:MAG TPA: hypothetical protein VF173_28005 [Thermoanaerobaculia bacterium]|nr:hypothetical protein [Thermoanaerobaculia bacterium]
MDASPDDASLPDFAPDGLDGSTGDYLHPGLSLPDLAAAFQDPPPEKRQANKGRLPRERVDPLNLASAGWAVVFPQGGDPRVREALKPLLDRRREQAGELFREYAGEDGYQPGERALDFLVRHRAGPGPADPRRVPYYLLLAGGPEAIPWDVQHQLDDQYAVGRLSFDTPGEYEGYARAVLEAEQTAPPAETARRAVFFGVENPGDRATELMSQYLVRATAATITTDRPEWAVSVLTGPEATKERLGRLLAGGDETPSLLFTASHGMGFSAGHERQRDNQGALLCSDWPGPGAWKGPIPPEHYFAAADLTTGGRLGGLIAFLYACHGAGTPQLDSFERAADGSPRPLAPQPFAARLPQRLLAAGALAVVGHVDRSWGFSFVWQGAGGQPDAFEDSLLRLLKGHPVGSALEPFAERSGNLASAFLGERFGTAGPGNDKLLARLWTAAQDARSYSILGDPAVRLR